MTKGQVPVASGKRAKDVNTFVNNQVKYSSVSNATAIPREDMKRNDLRCQTTTNVAKTSNKNGEETAADFENF